MGAFNIISAELTCPKRDRASFIDVQFKFGDTWQHYYRVGDNLKWGGNDVGLPDIKRIKVEAFAGPCAFCGFDGFDCDVIVAEDVIVDVQALARPRSRSLPDGFLVME